MALRALVTFFLFFFVLNRSGLTVDGQVTIPARFDGFVYKAQPTSIDTVVIEAFFDPVCPDSRDAWPSLKKAVDHYGDRVSLILHTFALPYHDHSFVTSRAMHIVNGLNSNATYDLLELFFKHQEFFYNLPTINLSRATIIRHVVKLATEAVGSAYQSEVDSGFADRRTDLLTRVAFKYGCSRGVYGTPFFFVNGFALPDGGSALSYGKWRSIIDPLFKEKAMTEREENLHFFL
ncbi:thioredoxin superfamily protein [Actinidia rufa]|uniref:Thioredoxin superfamily protein n=1 Tax=Actinidia rufa TaxID=165716 RepID=A0A7J0FAW9_9ERIC|nr:thioredoxin superfamily protein [Actinidia rufa]